MSLSPLIEVAAHQNEALHCTLNLVPKICPFSRRPIRAAAVFTATAMRPRSAAEPSSTLTTVAPLAAAVIRTLSVRVHLVAAGRAALLSRRAGG